MAYYTDASGEHWVNASGERWWDAGGAPPLITSNGGGATASVSVAENTTAVATVQAIGAAPIVYSITGGADAAFFAIDDETGALAFLAPPDFENPSDDDADGVYEVEVTATNAAGSDMQAFSVTGTDAFEAYLYQGGRPMLGLGLGLGF